MTFTIVIATRGRPELVTNTARLFLEHATEKGTVVLVCCDDDDPDTPKALEAIKDKRLRVSVKPREDTRGMKYNRALSEAPADLYLVGVDHTPVLTKGFDRMMLDAAALFPDGIGCVYTPLANASFPYLQAPTAKFCELMGYIQPPQFPFWFIDHWLDDVARMTGRIVMVDVVCDSSARPQKTTGLRDLIFWASYFDALREDRRAQANRIIDAQDEPEWRKEALRMSFPLVEYRSQWVNDLVRAEHAQMEQARGSGEPRSPDYLRALQAAVHDWERHLPPDEQAAA